MTQEEFDHDSQKALRDLYRQLGDYHNLYFCMSGLLMTVEAIMDSDITVDEKEAKWEKSYQFWHDGGIVNRIDGIIKEARRARDA
jgi:hypothetical protein